MKTLSELKEAIYKVLEDIERAIWEVEKTSVEMGILAHQLRNHNGGWVLNELLAAKAEALHALAVVLTLETK